MTLLEMFEKVNLAVTLEQRRFFNYYDDSVNELRALYEERFLFKSEPAYTPPTNLNKYESALLPLYEDAVIENILYKARAGGDKNNDVHKTEFMRKARAAFMQYWHELSKNKRMRRAGW